MFTHLARAGHLDILQGLAPNGIVIVPSQVDAEIQRSQEFHQGIPLAASLTWVELAVLTEEEESTFLSVKMNLGGSPIQHFGESAVGWRDTARVSPSWTIVRQRDKRPDSG
ncbi:MAG TPA: hypothetical protein VIU11_25985 [Nakamurella sp.]